MCTKLFVVDDDFFKRRLAFNSFKNKNSCTTDIQKRKAASSQMFVVVACVSFFKSWDFHVAFLIAFLKKLKKKPLFFSCFIKVYTTAKQADKNIDDHYA